MWDAAFHGLVLTVQWPAGGYLLLGLAIGMYFGAVPGLSGLVGMAILLPFTFGMEPAWAFAFLMGMYSITTTSDTISSVLLGIPGTAASQATILDGYPLAQKGQASRAFGAAFTVSAVGGVLGALVLALSIPIVRPLILSFASPEFFMLGLLALTMVGALSGSSIVKGLVAAVLGLVLSMIGYSPEGAIPRYWFDTTYLIDGLPLIPFVLGLFALPELLELAVRDTSISRVPREQAKTGLLTGMIDAVRNWWLVVRCTFIGVYIGLLPGVGGSLVDWVAYGHVVQSSKDKSQFGKGDIRGVIAPETANNAMKGGSLIPTIAFAVPGSASMAILLVAFEIQGLEPGPQLLTTKLDITFSLIWALALGNILGAAFLLVWGRQVAKLTFIRGHLIVPAITMFVFMGAWLSGNGLGDWVTLILAGILGYVMKQSGWPRPPVILGFILGSIMEVSLHISMRSYDYTWLGRPIVVILAVLILLGLLVGVRGMLRRRAAPAGVQIDDSAAQNPALSLPFAVCLLGALSYGLILAADWHFAARFFPFIVMITGIPLVLVVIFHDWNDIRLCLRRGVSIAGDAHDRKLLLSGAHYFVWMFAILVATVLIGQFLAIVVFVGAYLWYWGGYTWRLFVPYSVGAAIFLYIMFERIVPVFWYDSLIFS